MDILLSTGSLTPRNFTDIANIARRAGVDGLEVMLNGRLLAEGPERARRIAEAHDVPICSVHPPLRFVRAAQHVHDDMLRSAEYAAALPECRTLAMHAVGGPGLHTERGRAFFQTINAVTTILKRNGARLAVENRGTVQPQPRLDFLDKLHNLSRVCEEWDLDIVFDTSHAASFGLHIVPSVDVVFPRLANIHFSDRREEPPSIASGLVNSLTREHQLPGGGVLPLDLMLQRLHARGYHGAITLELSPLAVASWSEKRCVERVASAVAFVRDRFTGVHDGTTHRTPSSRRTPTSAENDF